MGRNFEKFCFPYFAYTTQHGLYHPFQLPNAAVDGKFRCSTQFVVPYIKHFLYEPLWCSFSFWQIWPCKNIKVLGPRCSTASEIASTKVISVFTVCLVVWVYGRIRTKLHEFLVIPNIHAFS